MDTQDIVVTGAREHNLKNITVRIPRHRLTVITGLSGSGKSSLAFDTIFAEGQRRYVESVSAYARQFLHQLRKPDVDRIDGLSPAIAIEQRGAASNPRSIVATATEIHDYLRLLYAHIGRRHCPQCHRPVARQTAEQMVTALLALPPRTQVTVLAPLVRGRRGRHADLLEAVRKQGFIRVRIDGEIHDLDDLPARAARQASDIEVVVDRLVLAEGLRARLTDSVELALKRGEGSLVARLQPPGGDARDEIFSEKQACLHCGIGFAELEPRSFSFNSPYGACPACAGLGTQQIPDESLVVPDPSRSLAQGAIAAWRGQGRRLTMYYNQQLRAVARHTGIGMDTPYGELPPEVQRLLMHGSGDTPLEFRHWRGGASRAYTRGFEGVLPNLQRRYAETESEFMRQRIRRYLTRRGCTVCGGARLRPEVVACTLNGHSIVALTALPVRDALAFIRALPLGVQEERMVGEVVAEIQRRLAFLTDVGLNYLTLDRESATLSGGELQRIHLATQIGSGLVGVLYVLDEPTVGLHARDTARLQMLLGRLRDAGNTVIVVEHDAAMIRAADHVLDLGPGAGRHGGEVVAQGTPAAIQAHPESVTGRYLAAAARPSGVLTRKPPGDAWLTIHEAAANNLRGLTVAIPLGLLVCVTGVSGSGKSSLVDEILRKALFRHFHRATERPGPHGRITGLEHLDGAIVIDQTPIGRTPRSNPATYTGVFTQIRALFAATPISKVRGYGPGRYSFNVKGGRCETCKGDGLIRLEMHFLPDVYVPCEACGGRRYNSETLQVHYQGKSIADVLALTVDEALETFRAVPAMTRKLRALSEVGLGYVQLGQSATTLSGGEAQRVKLATELGKAAGGRMLYLMDEPTTGLHFADIERLMGVVKRLRDAGHTVVVVEHHLDVIREADYIIDLGPEGGDEGGALVVCGSPETVAACPASHTGRFLCEERR